MVELGQHTRGWIAGIFAAFANRTRGGEGVVLLALLAYAELVHVGMDLRLYPGA